LFGSDYIGWNTGVFTGLQNPPVQIMLSAGTYNRF
jgi:hypothetical protein